MKPHEIPPPPESLKNQFVEIRAIRGLCGIGVLARSGLILFLLTVATHLVMFKDS